MARSTSWSSKKRISCRVSPGGSVPTGVVSISAGSSDQDSGPQQLGRAALTLKLNQALRKPFTVEYSGDANFDASTSSQLSHQEVPDDVGMATVAFIVGSEVAATAT